VNLGFTIAVPTICTLIAAAFFLTLERARPGRELPNAPGWYGRAIVINLCQVAITPVRWFRSPLGMRGESDKGTSEPKPHWHH
jgi:hypothetical protein